MPVGIGQFAQGFDLIRFQAESLFVSFKGFIEIAEFAVSNAEVVVGFVKVGDELLNPGSRTSTDRFNWS